MHVEVRIQNRDPSLRQEPLGAGGRADVDIVILGAARREDEVRSEVVGRSAGDGPGEEEAEVMRPQCWRVGDAEAGRVPEAWQQGGILDVHLQALSRHRASPQASRHDRNLQVRHTANVE